MCELDPVRMVCNDSYAAIEHYRMKTVSWRPLGTVPKPKPEDQNCEPKIIKIYIILLIHRIYLYYINVIYI